MCQAYQALPEVGGVLDQSVSVLRMHAVLDAGGYFAQQDASSTTSAPAQRDVFAEIPMMAL
jgi:hypothetical protein